jgi:SNF2 family DNA or RNA helicase
MRIVWKNDRFELEGKDIYDVRETIKGFGFTWDPERKVWYGKPACQLEKLRQFKPTISPEALEHHRVLEERRSAAVAASRATDAVCDAPAPSGLAYLPYQQGGIFYALQRPSTLFGDEMGLGKTIQAIGTINADPSARSVLVICPASLKLNWRKEFTKWDVKNLSVEVIQPTSKTFPEAHTVVINYELLKKWRSEIRAREWDVLVVDEAHYVKNPSTARAQEIFGRKRTTKETEESAGKPAFEPIKAKRRLFLTGTPIVNRPKELWPIINAIAPGFEKDFFAYAKKYCAAFRNRFGWDFSGASNLDDLQERMRALFMVRRLKKDVLKELPPKRRQVMVLEGDAGLAELLEKEKKTYEQYAESIKNGDFETPEFSEMSEVRKAVAVAKIPFIVEHINEALEELDKLCVFVHHYEVVDALVAEFGKACVVIDGRTKNEDRQAAVEKFQSDPECRVFIGTIRAAGVGITLTASSTVIFGELDWVPGNVSQAEDRCHRIGQVDTVFVRHLVLEGSLDERMTQIIIDKQDVIDEALDVMPASPRAPEFKVAEVLQVPVPEWDKRLVTELPKPVELLRPERSFTPEQEQAVLTGLRILAGNCDGAQDLDGCGFNKRDTAFGKMLAQKIALTEKMFAIGKKMVTLYHRQLPKEVLQSAGVVLKERNQ